MRTLGLVLAMVVVLAGAVMAETATYDVYVDWNCISAPLVPLNSDPLDVFTGINIVNNLSRFDAASQTSIGYDDLDPDAFAGVLLGDGYWLLSDGSYTVSYDGLADGVPSAGVKTDMWISLPGDQLDGLDNGGWHLIGTPFNTSVPVTVSSMGDNFKLTDGVQLLSWADAAAAGWCEGSMTGFDAVYQTSFSMGYDLCDSEEMAPGYGYYFLTFKDNLALIIPGS
ncbi:hypothetical protein LLG46_01725 [bacterium]|nr:hypothetical protein [bacterium]